MKIPALVCCLAFLSPITAALAVTPPPDGGYPNQNTAEGEDALLLGGGLPDNTALGYHALYTVQYGAGNTAVGSNALVSLQDAACNTAVGAQALSTDTNTENNTAVGYQSLNGITGFAHSDNTAVGYRAMANGDAYSCVAVGSLALENNKGQLNTAIGKGAMEDNTSGANNTACGWSALVHNLTGFNNTAIGLNSLANNTSGSNNIALGNYAGINLTSGNDNIDIGHAGVAEEAGTIHLGTEGTQHTTYISGIVASPLADGVAVGISPTGQLGVRGSSARFKEDVHPMARASEAILALQPVAFRYRKAIDPQGKAHYGLVAEDVEKVDPDLVAHDAAGKAFTVRYDEVDAMLLNEFLKEHRKVEEQGTEIAELRAELRSAVKQMRKVSAPMQAKQDAPRLVSAGE